MVLTREIFAEVNDRVQNGELSPGEAYKLLGRIQVDKDNQRPMTAEDKIVMVKLYTEDRLPCVEIGRRLKYSAQTIQNNLDRLGVTRREKWSHRSRLTDDEVREIRNSTEPQSLLARRFNVDQSTICNIKNRKSRAAVPDVVLPEGLEGSRQALNMLPTLNEAIDQNLRTAQRHADATRGLLKTVANTAPSD